MDILKIPYMTPLNFVSEFWTYDNPLYNWLVWGRIAENPVVNPTMNVQVITASAKNRYINSVTVTANTVVNSTITLEVGGEATYTFAAAKTLVNTDDSVATATLADGVLTILGVVAGSTTITLKDSNNDTVAVIAVTVT